jgi:arginyl-tRNA synthetase
MEQIEKLITKIISSEFNAETRPTITTPDTKFGDFTTNVAMQLAGQLDKTPRDVAEQITEKLIEHGLMAEVAGPGFINITVSAQLLKKQLDSNWHDKYGDSTDSNGKTAIVEYPSQNMAKPYSVGHLRPGSQGWAAKKLLESTGWKVITDNHLGDYGAPFGIWVVGFLKLSSREALESEGVYELGRVYIETKKLLKEEKEAGKSDLSNEVQDWLLRLENGDEEAVSYSNIFNEISLKHIHIIMDRLKISTDYELGESFFASKGKDLVKKYLEDGTFDRNSDGSVIARLDEYGIETPLLVLKSNGAALYATTDLATMVYREEEFQPDKVIYAVGSEQKFYFEQLFALAKKIDIKSDLYHLWFGVIDQMNEDGTREKMSSRKGVILMEELLNQAESRARDLVSGRDVDDEDIKKIALGAIKFSDFAADRRTNILFDWNTIFALTGFSGPYVQYAAVRVNKILSDHRDFEVVDYSDYNYEEEKPLIKLAVDYPNIVRHAAENLEPHKISFFLHNLAKEVNKYYEKVPVKDSSNIERSARLDTLKKVSQIFEHALDILGIEIPSKM